MPKILTFTGVSGTGKTTLCKELRPSDLDGKFSYLTKEQFLAEKEAGNFLWALEYAGNYYGTRKSDINNALNSEKLSLMILVPEVVPILQNHTSEVLSLFMQNLPESILRARLQQRGDPEHTITRRMEALKTWEDNAKKTSQYTFISNSTTIPEAIQQIQAILQHNL